MLRRAGGGGAGNFGGPGGPGGPGGGMAYSASSDTAGRYRIADIEPGRYRVSVERAGFVDAQYGAKRPGDAGTTLTLDKSQRMTDVNVSLTPHGVIAGRVLDEDGEPMMGASVQILQRTYVRGRKTFSPVDNASTNDVGEYRIFGLAPGKYVVSASYRRTRGPAVQEADAETYAQTFYPGGNTPDMAAPVDIQPGSQFRGLDLRLRKTRAVKVAGRIVGASGNDRGRGGTNVMLAPKSGGNDFNSRMMGRVYNAQGDFLISNVAPGSYILSATSFDGNHMLSARMPLDVGSGPIDGLAITLQPSAELHGRLKVEGSTAPDIKNFRVTLATRSSGAMMGPGGGQQFGGLKEDNTFTLANVNADQYDIRVSGIPDGGYVKSIKLGDADVTDTGLDFTSAVIPAELTVVVNMAAATIDGVVQTDQSQPASGVIVVLVPEGTKREVDRYYSTATTDDAGHFTLKNITPGEYRVYSFDNVKGSAYMDPEWLQPYETKGERVSVKESGTSSVQLKVVATQGV